MIERAGGEVQAFVPQQAHETDGGLGIRPHPVAVFLDDVEGHQGAAFPADGDVFDVAHRHPGQVDFGADLEAADVFEDRPVLHVLLKQPFLSGDDEHHDQQGHQ